MIARTRLFSRWVGVGRDGAVLVRSGVRGGGLAWFVAKAAVIGAMTNPLHAWLLAHPSVRHWMIAEYAGVHLVTVSLWRTGLRTPSAVHQRQIARFTAHHGVDRVTEQHWTRWRQQRDAQIATSADSTGVSEHGIR